MTPEVKGLTLLAVVGEGGKGGEGVAEAGVMVGSKKEAPASHHGGGFWQRSQPLMSGHQNQ